jgi:peptidyl-prolyl cis-trans isomerase A (cyclophilin A)
MLTRLALAAAVVLVGVSGASAQTVRTLRFSTNVGSFDMELNPTNDPNLQGLVNNLLAYVGTGAYDFSAINRAHENGPGTSDDFVLQMGTFLAGPTIPELWAANATPIAKYDAVVVDADGNGQVDFNARSNTRGTVSLALSNNPNTGTSSFFINSGDNSTLDSQGFVPFARITNMADVDRIMALTQTDLTQEAGVSTGNLAFSDVPLASTGEIVYITNVEVLQADANFSFVGPIVSVLELMKAREAAANASTAALASSSGAAVLTANGLPPVSGNASHITAVPEPSTVAISVAGMFATFLAGRRWTRR